MDQLPQNKMVPSISQMPMAPAVAQPPLLSTSRIDKLDPVGAVWGNLDSTKKVMLAIHGVILLAVSYHGFKRNGESVPWGLAWAVGGLVCPTVTMGYALTQGYGKRSA